MISIGIMINKIFAIFLSSLLSLSVLAVSAQNIQEDNKSCQDSLSISLITCDGYDEVWALYGHSALRIQNVTHGEDFAVNYGLFDFHQPLFPLKFALGHCDYLMGLVPFDIFLREFLEKGAGVFEQELNLTHQEKESIIKAIAINNLPENRVYRYNFYYDNCASRPRDIILGNIHRKIEYTNKIDETKTYRQLIHEHNETQRWCRWGNDMLLGVGSDKKTNREEQQFLPENLMRDFATANLIDRNGLRQPLVLRSQWVLPRNEQPLVSSPIPPSAVSVALFIIACALIIWEWLRKKNFWLFDAVLLAFAGIFGILLFFMLFSEHPTVKLNLQILVFNPLVCLFWWKAVKSLKNGEHKMDHVFIAYSILCIIAIFCNGWVQDFAEGFFFFTCSIIARLGWKIKIK